MITQLMHQLYEHPKIETLKKLQKNEERTGKKIIVSKFNVYLHDNDN